MLINKPVMSLMMLALLATGAARADVVDLGIGNANVYTIGDFSATNSAVQGAIVAGGNVTASSYAVNQNNVDAYSAYSLVAGGNLTYSNGQINNGSYYVGGSTSIAGNVGLGTATVSTATTSPVAFGSTSAAVKSLSLSLSTVASTGTATLQWGGLYLAGTGSKVEVFDISASELAGGGYVSLSGLAAGATVILNIAGTSASASTLNGFANYNVIYNFYQATSVSVTNVALYGTLLAPLATVTGGSAQVDGNVIAGAWDASVAVNANHYFVATDVAGYTAHVASAVPEPAGYALLLAGLGMLGLFTLRRRVVGARATPVKAAGTAEAA